MCQQYKAYRINQNQRLGLILLVVYFLCLVLPSFNFFQGFALFKLLGSWGAAGMSILYMAVFNIKKDDDGQPVADMLNNFKNGTVWPVLMLIAITLVVGNAMASADTGIIAAISTACNARFGTMNVTMLIFAATIIMGLLSQFMHNMVVGVLFIPILATLVLQMDGNAYTFFFLARASLASAFATPAASTMAGLIFGLEDVPIKHSYLLGSAFFITTLLSLLLCLPLSNMVF